MPQLEERRIGELDCHVLRGERPEVLVVLCHGFGAPGDDLVPLGPHLAQSFGHDAERICFVFPHAPLTLPEFGYGDARAWWRLDLEQLNRAIESGNIRDLRKESPPELPRVREMLAGTITQLTEELGLSAEQIVVGGFSQGSMLAVDYSLHAQPKPAGLVIWSGTLLNEAVWRPLAATLPGLKIVQSHGTQDPILPFVAAEWLCDMLQQSGADVEFLAFRGPHTIPPEALQKTAQLIRKLLKT